MKEHSSVKIEDLEKLDKLLDKKDAANLDWNKLQLLQQRLSKKINFLAEFIKDKEAALLEQKVVLEKAKLSQTEAADTIGNLVKELRGTAD